MFQTFKNAFKTPEICKKILITLALLLVYRIGCFVPIPGLDSAAIFAGYAQTDFTLMLSAITGSAFTYGTIFALGIVPFINSFIIMQLLTLIIPKLEKLSKEGLFDERYKKPIPRYPKKIGVITSPTGAAIRDIINVTKRRYPCVQLVVFPTLVQGPDAPAELTRAVEYFNLSNDVDTIIIGRGGGSIEDLWAFNDESLARAIFRSKIPVISGVGHEIDYTICDFVADIRAATPSAAAEIATPDIKDINNILNGFNYRVSNAFIGLIGSYRSKLDDLAKSKVFLKPETMLDVPKMRFSTIAEKLESSIKAQYASKKAQFAEINGKLAMLNPMSVISRGYGAVFKNNGSVIKSVNDVAEGEQITIKISDGRLNATVNSREEEKNG